VDALRRGRAWFADLAAYRGALDLAVDGRPAMGGVLITDAATVPVDLTATDLPEGTSLEVLTGAVDLAGTADLRPATRSRRIDRAALSRAPVRMSVAPGSGSYVRTQVRTADGTVIAVSNPLWLLRDAPPRGVPAPPTAGLTQVTGRVSPRR